MIKYTVPVISSDPFSTHSQNFALSTGINYRSGEHKSTQSKQNLFLDCLQSYLKTGDLF